MEMSKVSPQELTRDGNFKELMTYLAGCNDEDAYAHGDLEKIKKWMDDLPDMIRDLYPTVCPDCVQFAYDEMIEFRGDPLGVATQLHQYLTCDDPHDPSDCGKCVSWTPKE